MKKRYIFISILFSLSLHLGFFYYIFLFKPKIIEASKSYNVSLVQNFKPNVRKQFVSTFTKNVDQTISDTNFKSDKNTKVIKEQIKRGDNGVLPKTVIGKKNTVEKKVEVKKEEIKNTKAKTKTKNSVRTKTEVNKTKVKAKIDQNLNKSLDLSPATNTLRELGEKQIREIEKKELNKNFSVTPFSREEGANVVISGFSSGSSDYLPTIRDGDITLLNAKADRFAVFVRRVAVRVFQFLKQSGWERLSASQIRSIQGWSKIIGAINLKGKLVELKIVTTSGNIYFDSIAKESVGIGIVDPNPPKEAVASDGNIRFIFLAKSWSQSAGGGSGRNQRFLERRWLGLKTGLE